MNYSIKNAWDDLVQEDQNKGYSKVSSSKCDIQTA